MVQQYELKMPKVIYGGEHAMAALSGILSENRATKVAILTDKGVRAGGLIDRPLEIVHQHGAEAVIFDDLSTEPSVEQANEIIKRFRATHSDFIIGIGGGSVMDVAKLCSVLDTDAYTLYDLMQTPAIARKSICSLMIPTTSGTGAEATPNCIVTDVEKNLKVGIVNSELIADYVILDVEMIKDLPPRIIASTGIDALAHAVECYTSAKANPLSDVFALQALRLILPNIEKAYGDPGDLKAKSAMLTASFLAGVAITAAGTTAVHALSYPLGGKYHIPHGVSNAILLVPVMEFNEPACRDLFADIYDVVNPQSPATQAEKSKWVLNRLSEIIQKLNIPQNLSSFGIRACELDALVEAGMQVTRLLVNNRRPVSAEDARNIYLRVLEQ
jgi:alcohol dehydrogenase class IV